MALRGQKPQATSGTPAARRAPSLARWGPLVLVGVHHMLADGIHALVYPLLPVIADELHLSYAQAGLVRAAFNAAGAALQLPAGILAERIGEPLLLALGNGWLALGLVTMGLSTSFALLLFAAVAGGIGGNVQHPVGTSFVSRRYDGPGRGRAIGTLNFTGDIGKLVAPPLVGLVAVAWGWRTGLVTAGVVGAVIAAGLWVVGLLLRARGTTSHVSDPPRSEKSFNGTWGMERPGPLVALIAVGVLDSSVRGAALTLLPFVLTGHGLNTIQVSGLYTIIFAGGASGKFVCGWVADRFGNLPMIWVTEVMTAVGTVLFLFTRGWVLLPLALFFGFALNGTSSVLYSAVALLVTPGRRARVYGIYYTATIGASSLAPVLYGFIGDKVGLVPAVSLAASVTLLILPLSLLNRAQFRES